MIQPSPELLAVSRRWHRAILNGNAKELPNFLSDRDYLRFVGTAEGELWSGAPVRKAIGDFFAAIPSGTHGEETFAEAFEGDGIGWSCFTHRIRFGHNPDDPVEIRTTLIFALEDGAWKIVQRHASVPIPNVELMGTEQSAIADLVKAAQDGFTLGQREGLASVMFTDIVNSSRLASAMGDRLWSAEMTRHFAALRGIVEAGGGQFVKSLGDGTMSSFPSVRAALRAAARMQEAMQADTDGPAIQLRIGIHTGEVVQTEEDFFGTVVNKAARVAATAGAGEIAVSEETHGLAGTGAGFRFRDPVRVALKGFEGEHLIYRLEAAP